MEDGKKNLVDTNNICILCGVEIPEGRMVCGQCEIGVMTMVDKNFK